MDKMSLIILGGIALAAMAGGVVSIATMAEAIASFRNPLSYLTGAGSLVITSPFGGARNHNGIDLRAALGTKVFCPWPGKVLSIYTDSNGGNQLIILHDNGWKTGYAHLSKYNGLAVNSRVVAGQHIAFTGDTGAPGQPHLHFTITNPSGVKENPAKFLK